MFCLGGLSDGSATLPGRMGSYNDASTDLGAPCLRTHPISLLLPCPKRLFFRIGSHKRRPVKKSWQGTCCPAL